MVDGSEVDRVVFRASVAERVIDPRRSGRRMVGVAVFVELELLPNR